MLEFVRYEFEPPKYDVDECQQRGMTYAAPLKVTLRLIVFEIDQDTGAKSVKDIKEQDVYMGDMPLHDLERHLRRQWHRARHRLPDAPLARRVLRPRQGQDPFLGQAAFCRPHHSLSRLLARFRIRRQGHHPCAHRPPPQAADHHASLCAGSRWRADPAFFYKTVPYTQTKDGWRTPFDPQRYRGHKPAVDLIDAKTKQVVVEAGKKITPRLARKIAEDGVKELLVRDEDLYGLYLADELVNAKTGEIFAEAGDEITEKLLKGAERCRLQSAQHP